MPAFLGSPTKCPKVKQSIWSTVKKFKDLSGKRPKMSKASLSDSKRDARIFMAFEKKEMDNWGFYTRATGAIKKTEVHHPTIFPWFHQRATGFGHSHVGRTPVNNTAGCLVELPIRLVLTKPIPASTKAGPSSLPFFLKHTESFIAEISKEHSK